MAEAEAKAIAGRSSRIGEMLLQKGIIDEYTLAKALSTQWKDPNKRKIGEILVEDLKIDHHTVFGEFARMAGVREVDLANREVERLDKGQVEFIRKTIGDLKEDLRTQALERQVVPFKVSETERDLLIALAPDPTHPETVRLAQHFGYPQVEVCYARRAALKDLIERVFPTKKPIGEILLQKGILDEETLTKALSTQWKDPKRKIGEILVQDIGIDHHAIFGEFARLAEVREVDLAGGEVVDGTRLDFIRKTVGDLKEDLQAQVLERHVVPFKVSETEKDVLVVLTPDPTHPETVRLAGQFGHPQVEICYARLAALKDLIERAFPAGNGLLDMGRCKMTVREILDKVIRGIPRGVFGPERQQIIGEIVSHLPQEERLLLKDTLDGFITRMAANNASDVDMGGEGSKGRVWYRVFGSKRPDPELGPYTAIEFDIFFHSIIMESQRKFLLEHRNLDFSYMVEGNGRVYRYRGDMYFDLDHLAQNFRFITGTIRPFKGLELHPEVVKAIILKYDKQGLTLITGITGSGKSSTLDCIIDANNQLSDGHIVIIASPVETIHESKQCIVRHREVGRDVESFKAGAIQALRQDPDIIVIGEMRDPETIITALEITDSGHKVFSTLHTASAVESIDRIIGECPPAEQNRVRERLADTLKCAISQKLVPSTDGKRVAAKEIMLVTSSVRSAIKNKNTSEIYQMIHEGSTVGMNTMEQDLKRLYEARRISAENAMNYANNKKRMEELL